MHSTDIVTSFLLNQKKILILKRSQTVKTMKNMWSGISGIIECKGIIEIINKSTSSNIMCKYTEENGDNFFAQFFVQRGTSGDATVQSFEFVSASGRWEEMLGKKCLGAYTSMLQKRFMWQGKCDISDKTLEKVKNYKKPEW